MKKKSLTILNSITIANPCHESWENMSGDSKKKFCEKCSHSVTNLSEFTREEAAKILELSNGGRICVRYRKDEKGETVFKEAPARRSIFWHSASVMAAAVFALFGVSTKSFAESGAGESKKQPATTQPREEVMGDFAMPVPEDSPTPTPKFRETMGRFLPTPQPTPEQNFRMGEMVAVPIEKTDCEQDSPKKK